MRVLACWISLLVPATLASQSLRPAGTGGIAALADALRQLGSNKRVLVMGAHPDDENTQLLTLLARGWGAQVAYLSLTRGEGGQNLIGPELGVELGIIRSEELLAARELDGGRQFFTRAYDFGFSRSAEEAFRFWPRDTLLADVLRVLRRFRPQILVSIFSGTPRDGHGQHQAAGILARQAFEALADSSWGPVKLYRSSGYDTAGTTLTLPAGALDRVTGHSFYQIAMASRSRHRSQDMGQLLPVGPSAIRLAMLASRVSSARERGLWEGIDTVLAGAGAFVASIDSARTALNPLRPGAILPLLTRALSRLGGEHAEQREILEQAIGVAGGIVLDATADDHLLTTGQRVQVEIDVWNAGDDEIALEFVELLAPPGWEVQQLDPISSPIRPQTVATRRFVVVVPPAAPRSTPYFLRRPPAGALYDWRDVPSEHQGLPFEPALLRARARVRIAGQSVSLSREVVYRYRDQARGEIRKPLVVTGSFDVTLEPDLVVWPTSTRNAARGTRNSTANSPGQLTVTVTNRTRGPASARVLVNLPAGWERVPSESLAFAREDESRSFHIAPSPPANLRAGTYAMSAFAIGSDGRRSGGAVRVIDYPHIRPRALRDSATATIRSAPLVQPVLQRIGYVRGAADRVPEALATFGIPIDLLSGDSLARGNLARYDAIVVGSRAYETDPALVAHNDRLLEYVRVGGLLIVQYQQYDFIEGRFAPFPLSIARPHDRVTDENAPITPLLPAHPVFRTPNALDATDWRGWVQERGLYFARDWDSSYVALVETHDPGQPPLRGGLLVASVGRGTYVYTGLSFFRQLPAGVPGAFRLFANLLALKKR